MAIKQNYATKVDVRMLKADIETSRKAIEANRKAIDKNTKTILATRYYLEGKMDDLAEKFEDMLTRFKSEILDHIDGAVKELETARTERIVMGRQIDDHEKRISQLESTSA